MGNKLKSGKKAAKVEAMTKTKNAKLERRANIREEIAAEVAADLPKAEGEEGTARMLIVAALNKYEELR